jgi:hypothetical protein
MLRFWPPNSEDKLSSTDNDITLFLPEASVLDGLSEQALDFLDNITNEEKEEVYKFTCINTYFTTRQYNLWGKGGGI